MSLAKVYKTSKYGMEIYAVIIGNRLVGTFMSEVYANNRAFIINSKLRK